MLSFPPFVLDLADERLWVDGREVRLRRKPFAILCCLAQSPWKLVTHDQIAEAVWGGAVRAESCLRTHVRELRQVVGSGVIETVVGRGYRFIPSVSGADIHAREASNDPGVARPNEVPTVVQALVGALLQNGNIRCRDGKWVLAIDLEQLADTPSEAD